MHQWMSSRLSILLIAIHCTLKHTSTWNICSRLESRDGKKRVDDYYLELTQNPCICCCWWTMMMRWLVFHIRSCFLLLLLPDGGAADGVDDDAAAFNPKSNDDENDAFSRARFVMFCVWIIYIQFWIWIELCMVVSLPPLAALIEMHIYIYIYITLMITLIRSRRESILFSLSSQNDHHRIFFSPIHSQWMHTIIINSICCFGCCCCCCCCCVAWRRRRRYWWWWSWRDRTLMHNWLCYTPPHTCTHSPAERRVVKHTFASHTLQQIMQHELCAFHPQQTHTHTHTHTLEKPLKSTFTQIRNHIKNMPLFGRVCVKLDVFVCGLKKSGFCKCVSVWIHGLFDLSLSLAISLCWVF